MVLKLSESSRCSSDSLTITWGYGDLNEGEVQFNILGHMCNLTHYKLSLYTFDNKSSDFYNHTVKELLLTRNKNPLLSYKNFHSSLLVSEANLNESSSTGRKLPFCNQVINSYFTYKINYYYYYYYYYYYRWSSGQHV